MSEQNKRYIERMNKQTPYSDNREPKCKKCNDKGYILEEINNEIVAINCECLTTRINENKIKKSGLKSQIEKYTFDNFLTKTEWQRQLKAIVLHYLKDLNSSDWLVISGAIGSGKTHLCTAAAAEFIKSDKSFKYFKYAEQMNYLASRLSNFNVDIMGAAYEEYEELKNVDVLYIDDFIKTRYNEWAFNLIDYRYSNNKKTIISTEYSYNEMAKLDEALASRIKEKANKYWLNISDTQGKNQRLNK